MTARAGWALEERVAATADRRDRVVDAARAAAIVVVAVWHWTLSVTARTADGGLAMPNPLHAVPGAWALTWLLQVVPIFFLVGGYVNLISWQATRRRGGRAGAFVRARLTRLLVPAAVWAAVWLAVEALTAVVRPGPHTWVWERFPGLVTPLWFVAAYTLLIAAVPLTAPLHERYGVRVLAGLAGLIALTSAAGHAESSSVAAWVTGALVCVFVHQLGYGWRSWRLAVAPRWARLALAGGGLVALVLLTAVAGYPRAMVATVGDARSNVFPPTAAIAALAVFQVGVLMLATPALARLLQRPAVWRPVLAVNLVALTIYLWHMTAFLVVVWVYEGMGGTLGTAPTAAWWAQRWLWLLAPAAVLAVLVAVFGRAEAKAAQRGRGISGKL